jgi:ADP-ribosylglycohydrolase
MPRFEQTYSEPFAGDDDPQAAGNGSIMRLAPTPLFFAQQPEIVTEKVVDSSRLTHAAIECADTCRYLALLIVGVVHGSIKEELLGDHVDPTGGDY